MATIGWTDDRQRSPFWVMTIGCARCHDHKFEPFPQVDYYRLQAFFAPAQFRHNVLISFGEKRKALDAATAKYKAEMQPVQDEFDKLEAPHRKKVFEAKLAKVSSEVREAHETPAEQRTPAQRERVQETLRFVAVSAGEIQKDMTDAEKARHRELQDKLKAINAKKPAAPVAMGMQDGPPVKTHLLERGEVGNPAAEVQPGFPRVLGNAAVPAERAAKNRSDADRPASQAARGRQIADEEFGIAHALTGACSGSTRVPGGLGRGSSRSVPSSSLML